MKVTRHVAPICDCRAKLRAFRDQFAGSELLCVGTAVTCDCGLEYELVAADPRDGEQWQRVAPAIVNPTRPLP